MISLNDKAALQLVNFVNLRCVNRIGLHLEFKLWLLKNYKYVTTIETLNDILIEL